MPHQANPEPPREEPVERSERRIQFEHTSDEDQGALVDVLVMILQRRRRRLKTQAHDRTDEA
jgi:hypothetical protein